MIIYIPTTITNAMMSNTAVNADADYVPATVYALGDRVTYGNYIYASLQNVNTGKQPDLTASVAWWANVGVANKWAAFDAEVNTQTSATSTLSFVINADFINSVSLLNIVGQELIISVEKDAVVIYSETVDLVDGDLVSDWEEYFFSDWVFDSEYIFKNIPKIPGIEITLTINSPSNPVAVGYISIARKFDAGLEHYGLTRTLKDYTIPTFDKFGVLTLERQANAREFRTRSMIENAELNTIAKKLDMISGVPVVIEGGNGYYSSLITLGLISYTIDLARPNNSFVSFDVKGLI